MAVSKYMSARDRLLQLGEVFTGSELTILFGWSSPIASTYLAQWRKAGLVRSLGSRSDVHMNLLTNLHGNSHLALRRIYPNAVLMGIDVLRMAGWTTQIPARSDVAIGPQGELYQLDDFLLHKRSERWFTLVRPRVVKVDQGIDQLQPEWALADMVYRALDGRVRDAWLLDPEDLDVQAVQSSKGVQDAFNAFGLPAFSALAYEHWYRKLADRSTEQPAFGQGLGRSCCTALIS
jgi:hypothetical protein